MVWFNVASLAIRYRHILGYGLAVLALAFCVWYIHSEGYRACERDAMAKEIEVVDERIKIGNNRPSDAVTINRLRNGKF